MASGSVKIDFTGNPAGAQKAFDKMQQQIVKLRGQLKQLNTESAKGAKAQQRASSRGLTGLKSMAGGYLSVMQAVMQVTAAIRDQEQAQQKAATTTINIAKAQESAIHMLGVDIPTAKLTKRIEKIAAKTNIRGGKAALYPIAAETLSAAGEFELAMRAVETGARFGKQDPASAAAIAAGALDVSMATGEREDLMKNVGWLLAGTQTSRVKTLEGMSKYAVPAVLAVTSSGGTAEEAMALFNAATKGIVDPSGRKAGTAAIAFAEKLRTYLPEKDLVEEVVDPQGGVLREVTRKGTGLKSFAERMEYLMQNEAAKIEFESKHLSTLPKKSLGAFRALLGMHPREEVNTLVQAAYQDALSAQPTISESRVFAEKKLVQLAEPWESKVASAGQAKGSMIERLETETATGKEAARRAAYQWGGEQGLGKTLRATGVEYFARAPAAINFWASRILGGIGQEEAYEQEVRHRISAIREPGRRAKLRGEPMPPGQAERDDQIQILLDGLRDVSDTFKEKQDEQTRVLKDIDRGVRGSRAAVNANAAAAMEPR